MSVITRSWLSFSAIGAGIIHLALVMSSPPAIGIPLLLFGLAEIAWGVLILGADRLVLPRLAQAGAVAPLLLWSLLTVIATLLSASQITSSLPFAPMGIAALFELFIAGVLSRTIRRQAGTGRPTPAIPPASAVKYLTAVLLAGIVVGGLTTPALAATPAGSVAIEHGGTMGGMMTGTMPGMGH